MAKFFGLWICNSEKHYWEGETDSLGENSNASCPECGGKASLSVFASKRSNLPFQAFLKSAQKLMS